MTLIQQTFNLNKNSDNNFLKLNDSGGPEAKTKACLPDCMNIQMGVKMGYIM